jgi:hypothetical protein
VNTKRGRKFLHGKKNFTGIGVEENEEKKKKEP